MMSRIQQWMEEELVMQAALIQSGSQPLPFLCHRFGKKLSSSAEMRVRLQQQRKGI